MCPSLLRSLNDNFCPIQVFDFPMYFDTRGVSYDFSASLLGFDEAGSLLR